MPLAGRDDPGVVVCAASQRGQAAQPTLSQSVPEFWLRWRWLTCGLIFIPGHALELQNIEIDHDNHQFLYRYYSVNRAKAAEATEA